MWPNPQFPTDLVTFTEEIHNGKFRFLCSENNFYKLALINVTEAIFVSTGLIMFFSVCLKVVRKRFARVIFGVSSSPYLLNQTMRKHIEGYEFNTNFVNKVLDSFYVDEFSGGENDFDFLQLDRTLELHT